MTYAKACLGGLSALFLAGFVVMLFTTFRGMSQEKAVGLGALAAGVLESMFSSLFWFLAVAFFGLFCATGRLTSNVLRAMLFWLPTLVISSLGVGLLSLLALVVFRLKRS